MHFIAQRVEIGQCVGSETTWANIKVSMTVMKAFFFFFSSMDISLGKTQRFGLFYLYITRVCAGLERLKASLQAIYLFNILYN